MKKLEFTIESRDGNKTPVYCVKWMPDEVAENGAKPAMVLQIIHGMAEYVGRYEPFAQWLTDRNIVVCGNDHLGHGKTAKSEADLGYFCGNDPATVVVRDVHRLKKTVQAQYTGVPYFILGHSMGSFIARNYICRYGTGIQGAVIMGTGSTPDKVLNFVLWLCRVQEKLFGSRHGAKMINNLAFSSYTKGYESAPTGYEWLSHNNENVKKYVADPLCGNLFTVNGFETLFTLIGRLNDKSNLDRMPKNLPVLFISGSEDPVGNCGKAVTEVYDSFVKDEGMKDVTLKLVEGDRHEILNEDDHLSTYQYIYDWLMKRISKS